MVRGHFCGGQFSSRAIIPGAIVRGAIFLGGNCPRTYLLIYISFNLLIF